MSPRDQGCGSVKGPFIPDSARCSMYCVCALVRRPRAAMTGCVGCARMCGTVAGLAYGREGLCAGRCCACGHVDACGSSARASGSGLGCVGGDGGLVGGAGGRGVLVTWPSWWTGACGALSSLRRARSSVSSVGKGLVWTEGVGGGIAITLQATDWLRWFSLRNSSKRALPLGADDALCIDKADTERHSASPRSESP